MRPLRDGTGEWGKRNARSSHPETEDRASIGHLGLTLLSQQGNMLVDMYTNHRHAIHGEGTWYGFCIDGRRKLNDFRSVLYPSKAIWRSDGWCQEYRVIINQ